MSKILIDETTVQQALEALEADYLAMVADENGHMVYLEDQAITALREALAEQPAQQEPFGYFKAEPFGWTDCAETDEGAVALYTTSQPAQHTWVELTLEDMETTHWSTDFRAGAKWAAAKLKEKNNG